MSYDYIHQKLKKNNYKLTRQRSAILDVMIKNRGRHLSAEEVLSKAKEQVPNIGIATVYRTLDKLASLGVVYKTMLESDKYRYELSDPESNQHHHIICLGCGCITEVEDDLLHVLEAQLEAKGYKIVNHQLKFYGYCPQCNNSVDM